MYTDPDHLKVSDPGKIEGNVVFTYLDAFHPDNEEVESLKQHYRRGGLGDVTIKNILNEALQTFLAPIRQKRESLKDIEIKEILYHGTIKAHEIAKVTIDQVRSAIGLKYF